MCRLSALAGPGATRVVFFAVYSSLRAWRGRSLLLGLLEAHGAERQLDDRRLMDGGDTVGRDALGEQGPPERVVGLGGTVRAEILRSFLGEFGVLGLAGGEERLFRLLVGGGDVCLAAAAGFGQQGRLMVALLVEARAFGRIVLGQLVPVDLRPFVGEGLLEGRTVLLPPGRSLLDEPTAPWAPAWPPCAPGRPPGSFRGGTRSAGARTSGAAGAAPQAPVPGRLVFRAPELRRFILRCLRRVRAPGPPNLAWAPAKQGQLPRPRRLGEQESRRRRRGRASLRRRRRRRIRVKSAPFPARISHVSVSAAVGALLQLFATFLQLGVGFVLLDQAARAALSSVATRARL